MKLHFESALEPIGIDEKTGVIRGAVACTADVVARGHNLRTDTTLLHQLLESALEKGDKLPVHLDHKSGAAGCIGTAQNFRLTDGGQKLRCDLHLFKSHDRFQQVLELLSNLHETAGLSASFVGEAENGRARCANFLATDIVIFPAAAPNGLFSARDDDDETENESDDMNDENEPNLQETLHAILEHQAEMDERLSAIEDALDALEDDSDNESDDDADDDDQDDDIDAPVIREKGARSGPNFGADLEPLEFASRQEPGVSASGYRQTDGLAEFDFAAKVEELQLGGMDHRKAYIEALKSFARGRYQINNL